MNPFDHPAEYWQTLQQEFADQLETLNSLRIEFGSVRNEIFSLIDRLKDAF